MYRQVKTGVLNICKKVIRAKYLRVIKLATQNNIVCQESGENNMVIISQKMFVPGEMYEPKVHYQAL